MNLREYLGQTDPQPLPNGSVLLEESEFRVIQTEKRPGTFYRYVRINEYPEYRYLVREEDGLLLPVDDDGYPRRTSVFRIPVLTCS